MGNEPCSGPLRLAGRAVPGRLGRSPREGPVAESVADARDVPEIAVASACMATDRVLLSRRSLPEERRRRPHREPGPSRVRIREPRGRGCDEESLTVLTEESDRRRAI